MEFFNNKQNLEIIGKSPKNFCLPHVKNIQRSESAKNIISFTSRANNPLLETNRQHYKQIQRPKSIMVKLDNIIARQLPKSTKHQKIIAFPQSPYVVKNYNPITKNNPVQNNQDFDNQFNKKEQLKVIGHKINTKNGQRQNEVSSNSQFASLGGFYI